MFRDAYDLPLQAVAVALDRSSAVTADLIAGARLALMTAYDGVAPPDTAAHVGRQAIDLPGLAGVADGSGDPPTMLALRRHVTACPVCEDLLERMGRARRLALGLPVLALADADREELIEGTTAQAVAMLPTHEEVLAAAAAEVETRGLSLVAVAGLLVVAGAIGVGVGALSRHLEQSDLTAPVGGQPLPSIPADTPVVALSSRPAPSTSTKTSVSLPPIIISTSRSATPIRSTAPVTPTTSSPAVPAAAAIAIDPTTGPAGTPITVTGAGFLPGSPVTVSYAGSGTTTTSTDGHGNFQAVIDASAALPGAYDITASDGVDSASRTFHQTA
jgi:hypothetical protein